MPLTIAALSRDTEESAQVRESARGVTGTCHLGFVSPSTCRMGTSALLMHIPEATCYSQLPPLLVKGGPHSHQAKSFLDVTMSHIHPLVPLEAQR